MNIFEKANNIVKTCDTAYIGLLDDDGCPCVSTISAIRPEGIAQVYFSTGLDTNKAKRLMKDKRASVCFHSGNDNISLIGEAELISDQAVKSRCWLDWFINHYAGGETDPNYVVIRFTTKRVSLWIDREVAEASIDSLPAVSS